MSLEQDYTVVPGQLYACLSIVGPSCPQKTDQLGIKIRGAFATRDEAANHAKRLQKEDSTFDIYVVDMFKWLLIPPDPATIADVHYTNEKLEEIFTKYNENQAQAAKLFEERKRDMMAVRTPGDMPYIKPGDENSKYYSRPDEPPVSHPADVLEKLKLENPDAPTEELVKKADAIVAEEMEERRKWRAEREAAETLISIKEAPETPGDSEVPGAEASDSVSSTFSP